MKEIRKVGIKSIAVEKLFGLYDYRIGKEQSLGKIVILYGDNGSGKTTILKLIYRLLSTEDNVGHKSYIARVKFKSVRVLLANGYTVWVKRKTSLIGAYELGIDKKSNTILSVEMIPRDGEVIRISEDPLNNKKYMRFLKIMTEMNIQLYMMTDNRQVYVDGDKGYDSARRRHGHYYNYEMGARHSYMDEEVSYTDPDQLTRKLLDDSMNRAFHWIRTRVMSATSKGATSVNAVYSKIITTLVSAKKEKSDDQQFKKEKKNMLDSINKIGIENKKYSKFNLLPTFYTTKLKAAISSSTHASFPTIKAVLDPYLEGMEAKIRAYSNVQDVIERFSAAVNSFFVNKVISINVNSRIEIKSISGEILSSEMLSSGERHLLLLFCNAILAIDKPIIFIIDEPELSLNIKWQRRLIDSLTTLTGSSQVQFIFATHSIELITKHRDKICRLETGKIIKGK